METATFVDRTGWADGPWADEPDRMEWRDGSLIGRHPNSRRRSSHASAA